MTKAAAPQLHIVLVDIDPALDEAFNDWYDKVHIPDILACPGWLSATRHRCLEGGPRYAAIYEITGPEAYDTPEFHAIKGFGPFTPDVFDFRRLRFAPIGRCSSVPPRASLRGEGYLA